MKEVYDLYVWVIILDFNVFIVYLIVCEDVDWDKILVDIEYYL